MSAENDNNGEGLRFNPSRAVWVFEVSRPGYWGVMRLRNGMVTPICTRDLNSAPPDSNEVYKPPRKQSHLQVVK